MATFIFDAGMFTYSCFAVTAFRMRAKKGGVHYAPAGVSFAPLRFWKSPRTGVSYPVEMSVRVRERELHLRPLMDALYEPAVMEKVKQLGMTPEPQNMTIAQCEAFVAREREIWTRAIKLAKIEPQ